METLLATNILTRTVIGLRVEPSALQTRVPDPWQVIAIAKGAFKGANLLVIFNDALLNQDTAGNTLPDAMNRYIGFALLATHPDTGELANFPFRVFTAHPQAVPGRYKTAKPAHLWREQTLKGDGIETAVTEHFGMQDPMGVTVELALQYQRGVPSRVRTEVSVRSTVDPAIRRVHRIDQLVDVVRSAPTGVDRLQDYRLQVQVPELEDLFDGGEQLVGIAVNPWHVRQVFAP